MRDEWLIRGNVPMTKSEVRAVSLSKLEMEMYQRTGRDVVLYDIGAGTGSVAVEAALQGHCRKVYAIERNHEAVDLIAQNRKKFGVSHKIEIVEGEAPEVFLPLEMPTHAFIGGSGGNLREVLRSLEEKNPEIRVVINAVTLETISEVSYYLSETGREAEISLLSTANTRQIGRYHLMQGQNPVYIFAFGGGQHEFEKE